MIILENCGSKILYALSSKLLLHMSNKSCILSSFCHAYTSSNFVVMFSKSNSSLSAIQMYLMNIK